LVPGPCFGQSTWQRRRPRRGSGPPASDLGRWADRASRRGRRLQVGRRGDARDWAGTRRRRPVARFGQMRTGRGLDARILVADAA